MATELFENCLEGASTQKILATITTVNSLQSESHKISVDCSVSSSRREAATVGKLRPREVKTQGFIFGKQVRENSGLLTAHLLAFPSATCLGTPPHTRIS